jgi:tetratricopeptide (TPR) repeat protein
MFRIRNAISVLVILFFPAAFNAQSSKCDRTDYECQIAFYSTAVKENPKNIEAYYHLGFAYQRTRNPDRAMAMYEIYLAAKVKDRPNLANAHNNRAIIHRRSGKLALALADYNKAVRIDPNNPAFLTNRGNAYRDLSRFDDALADYRRALVNEPEFAPALVGRALAYGSTGDIDLAIRDLTDAIEFGSLPDALYNRGVFYAQLKEFSKAIADYTRYIETKPQNTRMLADAYLNRGIANYYTDNANDALADISKAIETNKELVNAYRVRSMLYREMQKEVLAEADETMAGKLAKNN